MILPVKFSFYADEDNPNWDIFDIVVDCIFFLDMILTFFTAYWDDERLVVSMRGIAINYIKFWFWVDVISILPFEQIMNSGDTLALVRISRLPRLYRLMKIFRMIRTVKVTKNQNNIWSQLHDLLKLSPSRLN
jgi:hypothetical protein